MYVGPTCGIGGGIGGGGGIVKGVDVGVYPLDPPDAKSPPSPLPEGGGGGGPQGEGGPQGMAGGALPPEKRPFFQAK
jgi:hypothetical protein